MERMILTPRLLKIASLISQDAVLADVGTDHGKLPITLLKENKISAAVASDINEGPLNHARQNAREHGVSERISFRLTAGLEGVLPKECDTISIAGMGGETIIGILQAAAWTKDGNHALLLQPMTMIPELRQWLYANGYKIKEETICKEGRKWYVLLSAVGGAEQKQVCLADCIVPQTLCRAEGAQLYIEHLFKKEKMILEKMKLSNKIEKIRVEEQEKIVQRVKQCLEELE